MRHRAFQRESGFIILFGHRTITGDDGMVPVQAVCPLCRQLGTIRGRERRRWFTFFFIPLFPLGTSYRFSECMTCGLGINRRLEQLAVAESKTSGTTTFAPRQGPAGENVNAIAMRTHHEMLANPEDPVLLLKLINLYLAMGEPSDAKAACRAFPIAYAKDPACAAAIGAVPVQ